MADEFRSLFDSFYDKLILRDLFGKVVPGLVFLATLAVSLFGRSVLVSGVERLPVPVWIGVMGLAWLSGFALQYLGELTHLLRTHPRGPVSGEQTRESFFPEWVEFQNCASAHERVHAERLNVIKEACGNVAVSLTVTATALVTALAAGMVATSRELVTGAAICVVMTVCFARMHVIHVERYGGFVRSVNNYRKGKLTDALGAAPESRLQAT